MILGSFLVARPGTSREALVARLLLLVALAATLTACGGKENETAPVATTAPPSAATAGDQAWERVVPGGDCRCSDG